MRGRLIATAALIAACLVAGTPVAEAGHPSKRCGTTTAGGKRVKVFAVNVSCDFAVTWTKRYMGQRRRPSGYTCTRINEPGIKLVMRCKRSSSRYFYAERP